jgi:hypothetical protein
MSVVRSRLAVAGVILLAGALQANAGDWSLDAAASCRVWNPHPQTHETVHWSGTCTDGLAQGPGSVQWSLSGLPFETDQGEWSQGRQSGHGTQVWLSGRYDGELVDGEPNGRGVLISQGARYEGEFRNGKPNGSGMLVKGTESFGGVWTDGCFREGNRRMAFGVPTSACP